MPEPAQRIYAVTLGPADGVSSPADGTLGHTRTHATHYAATVAEAVSLHGPIAPRRVTQRAR
jgi:hypothetical protein